jgi:hypothetical protein
MSFAEAHVARGALCHTSLQSFVEGSYNHQANDCSRDEQPRLSLNRTFLAMVDADEASGRGPASWLATDTLLPLDDMLFARQQQLPISFQINFLDTTKAGSKFHTNM